MTTVTMSASADTLHDLEIVIERGIDQFLKVGQALKTIRDNRLFEPQYKSFKHYLQERWYMNRSYAYQLISSVDVVMNLGEGELSNAYQAKPLIPLEPEEQQIVWQVVKQTSPTAKPSNQHIKSVVNVFKQVMQTGAIDGGNGDDVRIADVITHAITEETFERLQRQKEILKEKLGDKPRTFVCSNCGHVHTF